MTHYASDRPPSALDRAIAAHEAGRLDEAEAGYGALLADAPHDPEPLHLLGQIACERGNGAAGLAYADKAIAQAPGRAAAHATRARALALLGDFARAEAAYRLAGRLLPDAPAIANNLACLLRDRGDVAGAIEWFRRAASLAPASAAIAVNLAQALAAAGAGAASLLQFDHALSLRPGCADILYAKGHAELVMNLAAEAEASFRAAVAARHDHADSHNNLGIALDRQDRNAAASRCFRDALRCDPLHADAHYNLGCMLMLDNRAEEARLQHGRALDAAPAHGRALWARCMAELPMIYRSEAEIGLQRERYTAALDALAEAAQKPTVRAALRDSLGDSQPFFLPYQGQCDRDLQQRFGALVAGLFDTDPAIRLANPPADGARVLIGIVTGHACEHTVWRLMVLGWLTHLDRGRFSVTVYYTGRTQDRQTVRARRLADRFVEGMAGALRAAIMADRPHVLIYSELGMDPSCLRLAAERLAPVQCVGWGHPQTCGLASIDHFLTGAAMEPPNAGLHYGEQLVELPGLGVCPMPEHAVTAPVGREHFGLRDTACVFWCGQALYKYAPRHDAVLARIARAVPDSQFMFIGFARSRSATLGFEQRLAGEFAAHDLDPAHHLVLLDSMDQSHFLASVRASDIVLDSIGWSGGKSTLDMLAEAPAIVTLEGGLMRARHTAAILRLCGAGQTIVTSEDDYVALAVRLAEEPAERAAARARLAAGRAGLLEDLSPVRALEAFIEGSVR